MCIANFTNKNKMYNFVIKSIESIDFHSMLTLNFPNSSILSTTMAEFDE